MTYPRTLALLAALATATAAAQAQDTGAFAVPLAPGETVIGVYDAPGIVTVPYEAQPVGGIVPYAETQDYSLPPVEIDRVTGMPRNAAGWTGDETPPVAIACFPTGACQHLNR